MMEDLDKTSEISQSVGNRCEFQCPKCNTSFHSWKTMKRHLYVNGHGSQNANKIKNYLVKLFLHICKVCGKNIICDGYFLRYHIRSMHSLSINEYCKQYNIEHSDIDKYKKLLPSIQSLSDCHSENHIEENSMTNRTENMCTFQCSLCPEEDFYSMYLAMQHLRRKHKISNTDNIIVKESRYHNCLLCPKSILCDGFYLTKHFKSDHR